MGMAASQADVESRCSRQYDEEARWNAEHEAVAKSKKSRAIALDCMMNGTLEGRNTNEVQQVQRRQSWMGMPIKAMSKAQRDALKQYERQVQEAEENLRNLQRKLEVERKALEEEVIMAITSFNTEMASLEKKRLWAQIQVAVTQQLRLSNGTALLEVQFSEYTLYS